MKWMIVTSNINGPLSAAILSTSCEFTHLTLSNLGGRYTPVLTEEDIDTERVRNQPNVTQLGHKPRQPGCGAIISPHPLLFAPALEGPRESSLPQKLQQQLQLGPAPSSAPC